jgi:tyrosine-protein kinase Etk/Wzc
MTPQNDTLDLGEVAAVLARGWRWVLGGVLGGLLLAVAVLLFAPRSYEESATVLLRNAPERGASSLLGRSGGSGQGSLPLGGLTDLFSMSSGFDTEMEILSSRAVVGSVVDSLHLQARVLAPRGIHPESLIAEARFDPLARLTAYRFERAGAGYRVSGGDVSEIVTPGVPFRLGESVLTLHSEGLPDQFRLRIMDREEAIRRVQKRLSTSRAGGEVAELSFRGDDPVTAAAVPNALVYRYLQRRRSTDRGVNQQRYEFLLAHTDSIRTELALAERALRVQQQTSGVFDPEMHVKAEVEQAIVLRGELETREVEARALERMLAQAVAGRIPARELAAYPTFLQNPAINSLLSRLTEQEARRTELLDRRTENDPDVQVVSANIRQLEQQIVSLSRAYLDGLSGQQAQLLRELARYDAARSTYPGHAESAMRARREVQRLSETMVALQTQLVQARLAAISEGGEVRQIDTAIPPRKPAFPNPLLTIPLGLIVGLMVGSGGALASGYLGRRVRDGRDAELAAGVAAVDLDSRRALFLSAAERQRLLVIPVGRAADASRTATRIAAAAAVQGKSVVLADLAGGARPAAGALAPGRSEPPALPAGTAVAPASMQTVGGSDGYPVFQGNGISASTTTEIRQAVEHLESQFAVVVASLPGLDAVPTLALLSPQRSVVLAVRAGATTRTELRETVAALGQAEIPVIMVVVYRSSNGVNGSSAQA